jgi:hypothetical protein
VQQVEVKMRRRSWKSEDAVLVDIHLNSAVDTSARGIEAWFGKNDTQEFADMCSQEVIASTGFPARPTKSSDKNRNGRLGILDDTTPQACLIECGFLSNEFDAAAIRDSHIDDLFAIGLHHAIRRAAGFPADVSLPASGYRDVPDGAWYAESVKRLRENGIVIPDDNRLFHPDAPMNRAEAAVMFDRLRNDILSRLP